MRQEDEVCVSRNERVDTAAMIPRSLRNQSLGEVELGRYTETLLCHYGPPVLNPPDFGMFMLNPEESKNLSARQNFGANVE